MLRGFVTIAKKDLRAFFFSPVFYVVAFLCTMMLSWVFPIQLSQFADAAKNMMFQQGMPQQQTNIHYGLFLRQLSYLNLMLILIVPALTMRLISEEKKMHTFDLLLTSPVTTRLPRLRTGNATIPGIPCSASSRNSVLVPPPSPITRPTFRSAVSPYLRWEARWITPRMVGAMKYPSR